MKPSSVNAIVAFEKFITYKATANDLAVSLGNVLNDYAAMKGATLSDLAESNKDLAICSDLCQTLANVRG